MKKRRIMATITALAVAAAGFFVPASENNGLNVKTSAAVTTGGGLWLSKIKDAGAGGFILDSNGNDPWNTPTTINTLDEDINIWPNSLVEGDLVQLNIRIPALTDDLGSVTLKIKYDNEKFACVQWYQKGDEGSDNTYTVDEVNMITGVYDTTNNIYGYKDTADNIHGYTKEEIDELKYKTQDDIKWPAAGDYAGNTYEENSQFKGQANFKQDSEGVYCVSLMSPGDIGNNNLIKIYNGKKTDLHARFRVKKGIDLNSVVTTDFSIELCKFADKNGINIWTPLVTSVTAKISKCITGKLLKYDPYQKVQDNNDNGDLLYTAKDSSGNDVVVTLETKGENKGKYKDDSGNIYDTATPKMKDESKYDEKNNVFETDTYIGVKGDPSSSTDWWSINSNKTARWVKVDEDGTFTIRGVVPGQNYYLKTNLWCLNSEKTITANGSDMTTDISNWRIWLYGDVDYNGSIGANDSSQILKYLVGRGNIIKDTYATQNNYPSSGDNYEKAIDEKRKENALKIANLYNHEYMSKLYTSTARDDESVTVKSSTQILIEAVYAGSAKKSIIDYVQDKLTTELFYTWLGLTAVSGNIPAGVTAP